MDDAVLEEKFLRCTRSTLSERQQQAVLAKGWDLHDLEDVGSLVDELAV